MECGHAGRAAQLLGIHPAAHRESDHAIHGPDSRGEQPDGRSSLPRWSEAPDPAGAPRRGAYGLYRAGRRRPDRPANVVERPPTPAGYRAAGNQCASHSPSGHRTGGMRSVPAAQQTRDRRVCGHGSAVRTATRIRIGAAALSAPLYADDRGRFATRAQSDLRSAGEGACGASSAGTDRARLG